MQPEKQPKRSNQDYLILRTFNYSHMTSRSEDKIKLSGADLLAAEANEVQFPEALPERLGRTFRADNKSDSLARGIGLEDAGLLSERLCHFF